MLARPSPLSSSTPGGARIRLGAHPLDGASPARSGGDYRLCMGRPWRSDSHRPEERAGRRRSGYFLRFARAAGVRCRGGPGPAQASAGKILKAEFSLGSGAGEGRRRPIRVHSGIQKHSGPERVHSGAENVICIAGSREQRCCSTRFGTHDLVESPSETLVSQRKRRGCSSVTKRLRAADAARLARELRRKSSH